MSAGRAGLRRASAGRTGARRASARTLLVAGVIAPALVAAACSSPPPSSTGAPAPSPCPSVASAPASASASAAPSGSARFAPRPPAAPADVASIDAIVAALYDTISGPAGKRRDWDRLRSLFVPGGRLVPVAPRAEGGADVRLLDVEDYVTRAGPRLEGEGFFEKEVSHKVEAFGDLAHVFSTYETRHAPTDAEPFGRGINSIQLLKDGARWWVVSVYWDSEGPTKPLPAKYLPAR